MPYASNQGTHIHYEVVGEGPPLVLQHGFSSSLDEWHEFGYVGGLCEHFRLLLVDARGHGRSDKPRRDQDYVLRLLVSDIVAVLDHAHVDRAHYLGYSRGGWIGFGMAKHAEARLSSLVIGGAQPYGREFSNVRSMLNGIEGWMSAVEGWRIYGPEALARMRRNDPMALHAAIQDRPEMSDALPSMKMPCLLYCGTTDGECAKVERCVGELPNATFLPLSGLDHFQVIPRSDLVVPRVIEFLGAT